MSVSLRRPQPLLPITFRVFYRLGQNDFCTLPQAIAFALSQFDRDAYIEHLWDGGTVWSYRTHPFGEPDRITHDRADCLCPAGCSGCTPDDQS